MDDLFRSKREQLLEYIKSRTYAKSSDVARWGVQNYCNDSLRLARKLAEDKHIERLSKQDKLRLFGNGREEIWRFVK